MTKIVFGTLLNCFRNTQIIWVMLFVIDVLCDHFSDELLVLSSPGYVNVITFCNKTPAVLKFVTDTDDIDIDSSIQKSPSR
jgi:hypothetical protein